MDDIAIEKLAGEFTLGLAKILVDNDGILSDEDIGMLDGLLNYVERVISISKYQVEFKYMKEVVRKTES